MKPGDASEQSLTTPERKGAVQPLPSSEQVREFIRASKAENTLRGYQSDWRDFCAWCEGHGLCPLPASPETVAAYIAECAARLKVGSIQRRLNAIAEAHKAAGLGIPTHNAVVANTMKGIRRTMGTAPVQKAPALTDDIRAMVDATDAGMIGTRDRALILLGFAGAFRRSELVALDLEDCAFGKDGLTVMLRRSKTDQEGAAARLASRTDRILRRAQFAGASVDRTGGHQQRAAVPLDQSAWAGTGRPVVRYRRGAGREETGRAGRAGPCQVRRPLAPGRPCHQCGDCGRVGTVHHEPDRASVGSDGAAVHPGRQSVPRE